MEEACKSLKLVRFFIFSPLSFSSRRFFFVGIILSHRFHRYTQIFFIMIFLHRISRMNRKAFLLIGLLTDFRGILAAGQWLAPYICSCCFLSRRFRRWRRFFFVGIISSHRFHRYTQIFYGISVESLCPLSGGICTDRTGRLRENPWLIASSGIPPNKFRVIRWINS